MGKIIKDFNKLSIKDEFNKEEVMSVLEAMYDDWVATELDDRNSCRGSRGIDGMTTTNIEKLFNQMIVKLYYNGR